MFKDAAVTIVCVGATDDALRALLRDVFDDMGIRISFAPLWQRAPNLVLAAMQRWDAANVMAAARDVAEASPILAILPFSDERLVRLARDGGARSCFALDTPLVALRAAIGELLPALAIRRGEVAQG